VPEDDRYVLHPVYHVKKILEVIRVSPKYFDRETQPEWEQPDERPTMTLDNYKRVLGRIDKVKPLGQLRAEDVPNDAF
jgi:hypothetical protein